MLQPWDTTKKRPFSQVCFKYFETNLIFYYCNCHNDFYKCKNDDGYGRHDDVVFDDFVLKLIFAEIYDFRLNSSSFEIESLKEAGEGETMEVLWGDRHISYYDKEWLRNKLASDHLNFQDKKQFLWDKNTVIIFFIKMLKVLPEIIIKPLINNLTNRNLN